MRIKTVLVLLFLSLLSSPCIQSQIVTNIFNSPQTQADVVKTEQIIECPKLGTIYANEADAALKLSRAPRQAQNQAIITTQGHVVPPQDVAYLRSLGWSDADIANAHYVPPKSMSSQEAADLKAQGWTDEEIAGAVPVPASQQQTALSPTPPDLKNALVYIDSFLGSGATGFPADVISFKKSTIKFRFGGKDFDYSGNFSILLTTPRKHKNPYLGLGTPETAKLLILEDFFKGDANNTMPLQNATIWEKSDGYIVATGVDKEWIHSGTYSIQN